MSQPSEEISPASTDLAGRRYEFLALLGQGGFGSVHLCRMISPGGLEQRVAVKLLHAGLHPRSQAAERLRDEARTLAALRHPVLLGPLDLVELSGQVALVTEFIEGDDLEACIEGQERIPPGPLLEVIGQVASGLDAAWQQLSVIHRDIKPQNIRIGRHGNVKLLDFGIARSGLGGREAKTESVMLVGTLRYLAPERLDTEQPLSPASDIFSLGAVLYEGLMGEPLFGALSMTEVMRLSMVSDDWTHLIERRLQDIRAVPDGVLPLLRDMLAHDVHHRPPAASVVRRCEDLVRTWSGPNLHRWCRDRQWPEPLRESASAAPNAAGTRWHAATPQVFGTSAPSTVHSHASLAKDHLAQAPRKQIAPSSAPARRPSLARAMALISALSGALLVGASALVTLVIFAVSARSSLAPTAQPLAPLPALSTPATEAQVVEVPPPEAEATEAPSATPALEHDRSELPAKERPVARERPLPLGDAVVKQEPAVQASHPIVLASIPAGAEIWLVATGERLGTTPLASPLPAGVVHVRMTSPGGASIERALTISKNAPRRYVWYVDQGRLEAGY